MIKVEGLTKHFGDFVAVEGVSFEAKEGEILGFLGPNGAGKTTTMRMLTGFMPATSGTARIAGFDLHAKPEEVRRRIGYLPEHPPLYEDLTVRVFLDFVARIKGMPRKGRKQAVEAILPRCGLEEVADRAIEHLSKGYKQRVGLAQALVHNPPVLILDEPTIGLDPAQIVEIRSLIRGLAGGHTVILSTHILPEVTQICDHVVIIRRGAVVADDTFANLASRMDAPGRLFLRLENADGAAERIGALPGILAVERAADAGGGWVVRSAPEADAAGSIADLAARSGWRVRELRPDQVTLEQIYIRLTSQ